MRSPARSTATARLAVLRAVVLVALAVLGVRAAHLALWDTRSVERVALQTHTTLRLAPARGLIVDRSGKELAVGIRAPSVYASPAEIENPRADARALAHVLGLDRRRVERRLRGPGRFTFLARWVTPDRARRVEALGLRGVGVVHEPRRAYPAGALAAPVLGFTNIDGRGVRGIEQQEDAWLAGAEQTVPVERDARGHLLARSAALGDANLGGDVMLTLDASLQAETEAALRETVEHSGARGGVVVVMEPSSGAILALAEYPSFDPNRFRDTAYADTRSRAFLDAWEPGSTLKVFLAAAALESSAVGEHELIDCEEGSYRVPGKTIHDAEPHGLLPLAGVIRVSSNIGAVKLAERVGAERHYDVLRAFGFGSPSGSGFPDESSGVLRGWRDWRPVDQATIAFGQGVSVTPVQLATAVAALANGGEWVAPRLVAARREAGGDWRPEPPGDRHRAVSRATANTVLRMMEGVVSGAGTGRRAGLRDLSVAGKTGTAQKIDPRTGSYSQTRYVAWFVGVAPADDPRLVAAVAIDEPKGPAHTGGAVAAPLFARVAAAHLGAFGILTRPEPLPREEEAEPPVLTADARGAAAPGREAVKAPEPAHASEPPPRAVAAAARAPAPEPLPAVAAPAPRAPAPQAAPAAIAVLATAAGDPPRVLLPDFEGLTVAEVVRLTKQADLELEITGRGRAVSQDPEPGTILGGERRRVHVSFGGTEAEPVRVQRAVQRGGEG